jgi:histidinol-phosphate aminotransferase
MVVPSYKPYLIRAQINGLRTKEMMMEIGDGQIVFPYKEIYENASKESLLLLGYPNNPTGHLIDKHKILGSIDDYGLVVIDEAYFEFSKETFKDHIDDHKNLIIIRTMSKAFSLAGLRIGYILAPYKIAAYLEKIRDPFPLSRVSETMAVTSLRHIDKILERVEAIRQAREYLYREINKLKIFRAYLSYGNFVLVESLKFDALTLTMKLLENNVIIRPYEARGLDLNKYVRITASEINHEVQLIEILREMAENYGYQ